MRGSILRLVISTYCPVIRDNDLFVICENIREIDFNLLIKCGNFTYTIQLAVYNKVYTKNLMMKESSYLTLYI